MVPSQQRNGCSKEQETFLRETGVDADRKRGGIRSEEESVEREWGNRKIERLQKMINGETLGGKFGIMNQVLREAVGESTMENGGKGIVEMVVGR